MLRFTSACFAVLRVASIYFSLLSLASVCLASVYLASPCFGLPCFTLLWTTSRCSRLLHSTSACFSLLCITSAYFALLELASPCFARGPSIQPYYRSMPPFFTRALSVACVLARPRQGTNSLVFGPYSRPYFSSHTHRRDLKQLPSKPSRREEANYNKRILF